MFKDFCRGISISSGVSSCLLLGVSFLHQNDAQAQAAATATRLISVSAFAGAQAVHPEFNASPNIYGFLLGGDLTHYYRLVSPSLEVRFARSSGSTVTQRSFLVGIKAEHSFGREQRLHPYLVGLIGPGTSDFENPGDPTYNHDNTLVLGAGAGVDVDLTPRFAVKGEIQIQRWHLGAESPVFSPESVSVALVYHPSFGRLLGR